MRTDCTSSRATAAVLDVPSPPSRLVSLPRSAREREWSSRLFANPQPLRNGPRPARMWDFQARFSRSFSHRKRAFDRDLAFILLGLGTCVNSFAITGGRYDFFRQNRGYNVVGQPSATHKTAFLEHGVYGSMGVAETPPAVLISQIAVHTPCNEQKFPTISFHSSQRPSRCHLEHPSSSMYFSTNLQTLHHFFEAALTSRIVKPKDATAGCSAGSPCEYSRNRGAHQVEPLQHFIGDPV